MAMKSLKKNRTTGLRKKKPDVKLDYSGFYNKEEYPDQLPNHDNVLLFKSAEEKGVPTAKEFMELNLTPKQKAYIKFSNKKYNFKVGAARVGKTYIDFFMIMIRIMEIKARGLRTGERLVIIGRTFTTAKKNIYEGLVHMWGRDNVSTLSSDGAFTIRGIPISIFGADNVKSREKIQGQTLIYAYCDEITTWHPEVFFELTNRLDKDYSLMDATCNPKGSKHFVKEWIDKRMEDAEKARRGEVDEDGVPYLDEMFYQHYTIDDGMLSETSKASIKATLKGTVDYGRRVLGLWIDAEGLIYTMYAGEPTKFERGPKVLPKFSSIQIGVDFGYGSANHAIVATAISDDGRDLISLRSLLINSAGQGTSFLGNAVYKFINEIEAKYGVPVDYIWYDSANETFGDEIKLVLRKKGRYGRIKVDKCYKGKVVGRITLTQQLMNEERFYIVTEDCESLHDALMQAIWDPKKDQTRLKDGSQDVDTLDAFEYSFHRKNRILINSSFEEVA